MKKSIISLIIFSMLFSVGSFSYGKVDIRGNSIGNVANYGNVAEYNGWVYYSFDESGLFKVKKDGSKTIKICDYYADDINVVGDYIYCSAGNGKDSGVFKIKTDGSVIKKLCGDDADYMNVVGNWIYYVNAAVQWHLYKMKLDGTGRVRVTNYSMSNINVIGDWIYFENHNKGASLYKMKTDGSKMTQLCDLSEYRMEINVIGDWIYFVADDPNTGLYKIRTDGTQFQKLSNELVASVNVVNDTIYYVIYNDGIYKMKVDGSGNEKLIDGHANEINLANGWIYYSAYKGGELEFDKIAYYKIKIDGSSKQAIFPRKLINEHPDLKYIINGVETAHRDVPIDFDGVYMHSLKELLQMLGMATDDKHLIIDNKKKSVIIKTGQTTVSLSIDSNVASMDSSKVILDSAPIIYNDDKVYVPTMSIAKLLSKKIDYENSMNAILVSDDNHFNQIQDILAKADLAMSNLKRYKLTTNMGVDAYQGDRKLVDTVQDTIEFSIDQESKEMSVNAKFYYNNKNIDNVDIYFSNNTLYRYDSTTGVWTADILGRRIEYENYFNQLTNKATMNTKTMCMGLILENTADPNNFVLKGDIPFQDLYDNSKYLLGLKDGSEYKYHTEITISKNTYYISKITMSIDYVINETQYNLDVEIIYDNYNGDFVISVPDEAKGEKNLK